jgi:hypothetical protein
VSGGWACPRGPESGPWEAFCRAVFSPAGRQTDRQLESVGMKLGLAVFSPCVADRDRQLCPRGPTSGPWDTVASPWPACGSLFPCDCAVFFYFRQARSQSLASSRQSFPPFMQQTVGMKRVSRSSRPSAAARDSLPCPRGPTSEPWDTGGSPWPGCGSLLPGGSADFIYFRQTRSLSRPVAGTGQVARVLGLAG